MHQLEAIGSIAKGARVLSALADAPNGASLSDIVARAGFTKTTAFRVLAALRDVNYVYQEPETRMYRLSVGLADLARGAAAVDLAALAGSGMERLAELSGDTVFLSIREGLSAVCVARRTGAFPIRTLTLDKGDRRPLGVGAGALALYCAMPERSRMITAKANAAWLATYGFTAAELEDEQRRFLSNGYVMNRNRVTPGMSAIGAPIIADGLIGALSLGAIDERMNDARVRETLFPALRAEIDLLAAQIAAETGAARAGMRETAR
ncbi:MAG: helix-turn-helix domain-containing protein [Paracoccaceae bacterium]